MEVRITNAEKWARTQLRFEGERWQGPRCPKFGIKGGLYAAVLFHDNSAVIYGLYDRTVIIHDKSDEQELKNLYLKVRGD